MAGNYFNQIYPVSDVVPGTLTTSTDGKCYIPVASKLLEFGFTLDSSGSGTGTTVAMVDSAGTTLATAGIAGAATTLYTRASSITQDDAESGWGTFDLISVAGTTAPTGAYFWALLQGAA